DRARSRLAQRRPHRHSRVEAGARRRAPRTDAPRDGRDTDAFRRTLRRGGTSRSPVRLTVRTRRLLQSRRGHGTLGIIFFPTPPASSVVPAAPGAGVGASATSGATFGAPTGAFAAPVSEPGAAAGASAAAGATGGSPAGAVAAAPSAPGAPGTGAPVAGRPAFSAAPFMTSCLAASPAPF